MRFTKKRSRSRAPRFDALPPGLQNGGFRCTLVFLIGFIVIAPAAHPQPRLEPEAIFTPPYDGLLPQVAVALTISPADYLYLLDPQLATVARLTLEGKLVNQVGGPGSGLEQFSDPADLCINFGLDVFVADRGNDRIVRLDRKLNYLAEFRTLSGTPGNLAFENPLSVLLGPRGDLYIADGGNDRILKLDPTGKPVFSFGAYGDERGSLFQPRRIEMDQDGSIWVLDLRGHVVHFDEYGGYLEEVDAGVPGRPTGLAVSQTALWVCSDSTLWVYDRTLRRTRMTPPTDIGLPPGAVPVDLCTRQDLLWILDRRGAIYRFHVFNIP